MKVKENHAKKGLEVINEKEEKTKRYQSRTAEAMAWVSLTYRPLDLFSPPLEISNDRPQSQAKNYSVVMINIDQEIFVKHLRTLKLSGIF